MKTRRSDTQFRRMLDRLEVEVAAAADGQTSIDVRGPYLRRVHDSAGPDRGGGEASADVHAASQQLVEPVPQLARRLDRPG